MTAVTELCVHGCASARSPLPPLSVRAHLAPPCPIALHLTLSVDALATAALRRYLYNNQLNGPIPIEIGLMTALTGVCVQRCASAPPSALGARSPHSSPPPCTSSHALRWRAPDAVLRRTLDDNQLSGPIPPEVGQMTGLQFLCVPGCAPARSLLSPPSPRAHLALLRLHALHLTLSVDTLASPRCAGTSAPTSSTARSQPKLA